MSPDEFARFYPVVIAWISQTSATHAASAKTVASVGFKRLPLYLPQELLQTTKFVSVTRVPTPPLSSIGLQQFRNFERADFEGITYLDTIFLKRTRGSDEQLHFHELIHVLQWRLLGPEGFLKLYADGLEKFGYWDSPLEKMAYCAQREFGRSKQPFDARNGCWANYGNSGLCKHLARRCLERHTCSAACVCGVPKLVQTRQSIHHGAHYTRSTGRSRFSLALCHDGGRSFALAHAGTTSHAESNDGPRIARENFDHWNPPNLTQGRTLNGIYR